MDSPGTDRWAAVDTSAQVRNGVSSRQQPGQPARGYALTPRPYPAPGQAPASRPVRQDAPYRDLVSPNGHGHSRRSHTRVRRLRTWPQRVGGPLIAGACVVSALWYVPQVMSSDRNLLTGTVVSSGIVTLNFADAGEIAALNVRLNQPVRKGQLLASEYSPDTGSLLAADRATIAADKAKIKQLKAAEAANPAAAAADNAQISADMAQLALDQAEKATDQAKLTATEIMAPSGGVVVAVNGQPGETVTSSGIRDYATDSHQAAGSQSPPFSLLPEGPQPIRHTVASSAALPVIALRVSATWQVIALIPEKSVSAVKAGQAVTINVPAARVSGVRGQIDEVLPTPVSGSGGAVYQAVVTITGYAADPPLNGMAADVRLDS